MVFVFLMRMAPAAIAVNEAPTAMARAYGAAAGAAARTGRFGGSYPMPRSLFMLASSAGVNGC